MGLLGSRLSRGGGRAEDGRDSASTTDGGNQELDLNQIGERVLPVMLRELPPEKAATMPRGDVARAIKEQLPGLLSQNGVTLNLLEQRDLVTFLINKILSMAPKPPEGEDGVLPAAGGTALQRFAQKKMGGAAPPGQGAASAEPSVRKQAGEDGGSGHQPARSLQDLVTSKPVAGAVETPKSVEAAMQRIQPLLLERIDTAAAASLNREELFGQIGELIGELLAEAKLQLNRQERELLVDKLLDDMLGLGPLEPLLGDESVTDIMVNGPKQIYVERKGKLTLTSAKFRDDQHVMSAATRIVSAVGRRVDESVPLVDARLADGSRVNIIIPPLAIDGPTISIRKFAKKKITLDVMERQNNISPNLGKVLRIASRSRLNILISGGTGSGKTTLLNALSQMIDPGERIVTIEDAAELQLQQPHVVRLETRPANLEGKGEITMRDLVKNALRMRPDRIILGEIRSSEAIDMLQAMNTGHDGSLGTIHANRPREALMRLENMVGMAGVNLSPMAVRTQIASAVDMIVQISRMRDGVRRVTHVSEVMGMEGDVIIMQDLFLFNFTGEGQDGELLGEFKPSGIRPHFTQKAAYFGLDKALLDAV